MVGSRERYGDPLHVHDPPAIRESAAASTPADDPSSARTDNSRALRRTRQHPTCVPGAHTLRVGGDSTQKERDAQWDPQLRMPQS